MSGKSAVKVGRRPRNWTDQISQDSAHVIWSDQPCKQRRAALQHSVASKVVLEGSGPIPLTSWAEIVGDGAGSSMLQLLESITCQSGAPVTAGANRIRTPSTLLCSRTDNLEPARAQAGAVCLVWRRASELPSGIQTFAVPGFSSISPLSQSPLSQLVSINLQRASDHVDTVMANPPMDIPLMAPPAGQMSDFHAQDLQPVLIGVHAAFLSLAVIIVALRFYIRGIIARNLWWEDCQCRLSRAMFPY
nr:hypothetical protein CFP56_46805 [Quercus suber]